MAPGRLHRAPLSRWGLAMFGYVLAAALVLLAGGACLVAAPGWGINVWWPAVLAVAGAAWILAAGHRRVRHG